MAVSLRKVSLVLLGSIMVNGAIAAVTLPSPQQTVVHAQSQSARGIYTRPSSVIPAPHVTPPHYPLRDGSQIISPTGYLTQLEQHVHLHETAEEQMKNAPTDRVTAEGEPYFDRGKIAFNYHKIPRVWNTPVIPIDKPHSAYAAADLAFLPMSTFSHQLPPPAHETRPPEVLTLRDSIFLALRNNPTVINSELQRIVDKFAVIVARNQFEPQYAAGLNAAFMNGSSPVYGINSSVKLLTTIGTQFEVTYNNAFMDKGGAASITVDQPLMRGFGYVNRIPYENALDGELNARLGFKNSMIGVVVAVINAYHTLVEDYNNIDIQRNNLEETINTVNQYRLQVRVGKMAGSDLQQQEGNLASAKLSYIQTKDTLQTDYQAFLGALGLITSAKLRIITKVDDSGLVIPSKKEAITIALKNNIAYRQAVLAMRATKRAIISAQDARKPQLDLALSTTAPDIAQINSTGSTSSKAMFTFSVPIDDVAAQEGLVSAKIAFKTAKISLSQQKENLIRSIITQINSLHNTKQSITIGKQSVKLAEETLKNARIKQRFGKATMFEVIQDQNALLSERTSLVSTEISFLDGIASLNEQLGVTLDKWDIKLRY